MDEDITVFVSYKSYLTEEIDIYKMDNDKFIKVYDIFKSNELKITDFKENIIKGKIKLSENSMMYTSIPYDKGWKVYSNNKKINTYKINDTLLGFTLPKGDNNVELKYIPNNIDIGISISITTLIFTIIYICIKRKKSNRQD